MAKWWAQLSGRARINLFCPVDTEHPFSGLADVRFGDQNFGWDGRCHAAVRIRYRHLLRAAGRRLEAFVQENGECRVRMAALDEQDLERVGLNLKLC